MGKKIKDGKNQRTILSENDVKLIEETFINMTEIEKFSVIVKNGEIINKNYSWSAGQYFDVKVEYVDITKEEFNIKINDYTCKLQEYFNDSNIIQNHLLKVISRVKYE